MRKVSYKRYTDLPALIQILTNRKLTLLDPSFWDDKNDSYFLATYKEKKMLQSVLALCFTKESETYHHWRVFSSGSSGICVNFNSEKLEAAFAKTRGVKFQEVTYLTLNDLRDNRPTIDRLPFIKRKPYKHEKEFRALWESKSDKTSSLDVPIDISIITRITLSPWMHPSLRKNVVKLLKMIDGCKSIPIRRSTLIENTQWKSYGISAK
ncbi:DUF2971 domain-containing protein [Proteus mirabilis]|uniref:DUF2971 domain-containing protein n=1 Tax=Proteus mirabilis TaxID=584 RepID=UPI00088C1352|nr:DUF2971 domain-containing protein [Proteus mirabilis]MBU9979393.1 DUF2971 domain-containing protein [Proteus mirabilis]MCU9563793.1 DUF2971 domain-containing protein [Proteus mirabilis]SDC89953.1 hypothetical protein SAMN05216484_11081 [Proteus mirabilis]HCT8172799.1 DUF2971 domain-containing protein [Proteus mirabilis]HDU8592834.1 DUF2971 domain-containing protein [Proteus mirabilis]